MQQFHVQNVVSHFSRHLDPADDVTGVFHRLMMSLVFFVLLLTSLPEQNNCQTITKI
jgi:hypothetical protein